MRFVIRAARPEIDSAWLPDPHDPDVIIIYVNDDLDAVTRQRLIQQAKREAERRRRPVMPVIAARFHRAVVHHKAAAVAVVGAASVTAAMMMPIPPPGEAPGRPPATSWHVASRGEPTSGPRLPPREPLTPDTVESPGRSGGEESQPLTSPGLTVPDHPGKAKAVGRKPKKTPPGLAKKHRKQGKAKAGKRGHQGKHGKGRGLSKKHPHPHPPAAVPSTHVPG